MKMADTQIKAGFPDSRIDLVRTGIYVDGVWYPPVAYTSYLPRTEFYRQVAGCGVHLYCFPAYLAGRGINIHSGIGPFRRGIWQEDGMYDFAAVTEDLDRILAADPEARIIMRLHLDVPEWWEQRHPDGCCQLEDGRLLRQSFSSPVWLDDMDRVLREVVAWLHASRYAPYLIGVHLAAGGTEEWVHHYFQNYEDKNPSRAEAFAAYLAEVYPDDTARRAAWGQAGPAVTEEALCVLSRPPESRWRDSRRDAAELDACHFHSTVLTDAICRFCAVVKEAGEGRLLTGVFYGYHLWVTDSRKGHTALSRLLECESLDYIASPNLYCRQPGLDWSPMAATGSVRLHGKLWMAENDTRTVLTRPLAETAPDICPEGQYRGGVWAGPESLELSVALLRANAARMVTHGYGGWWFDMWGGWFAHPLLLAELAAAQALWRKDDAPPEPEAQRIPTGVLCIIVDGQLAEYDASYGDLCNPILYNRQALENCGRPWVVYLRSDLPRLDLSGAAFIWLLGIPELAENERALLNGVMAWGGVILHTDFEGTRRLGATGAPATDRWWVTLSLAELQSVLDGAGIHRYLESPDVFYMGRGYVAIHATECGEKRLRFPAPVTIRAILPEIGAAQSTHELIFSMARHETRIFEIMEV